MIRATTEDDAARELPAGAHGLRRASLRSDSALEMGVLGQPL